MKAASRKKAYTKNKGVRALEDAVPGALILAGVYAFLLGTGARPLMSGAIVAASCLALRHVSRLKEQLLEEPLVPSDMALAGQALRYPALYISFIGYRRFIFVALSCAAALTALWLGEAGLRLSGTARFSLIMLLPAVLCLNRRVLARRFPVTLDPAADMARYGLAGMLALYFAQPRPRSTGEGTCAGALRGFEANAGVEALPDIVLIQSESFQDPRLFWPGAYGEIARRHLRLPALDRLRERGGDCLLSVPASGANTMRTEFAALSGMTEDRLGVYKFNPYLLARRSRIKTWASVLRDKGGYETSAVHPFKKGFFGRDLCFPNMGFSHFADESAFKGAARRGPYVADEEIAAFLARDFAERAASAEKGSANPRFIFAVTMENHGPWGAGRYRRDERESIRRRFPGLPFPMAAYCHHLTGTDRLVAGLFALEEGAAARGRPFLFALYGDHRPVFPGIDLDLPRHTDCLFSRPVRQKRIAAAEISAILLGISGVEAGCRLERKMPVRIG